MYIRSQNMVRRGGLVSQTFPIPDTAIRDSAFSRWPKGP